MLQETLEMSCNRNIKKKGKWKLGVLPSTSELAKVQLEMQSVVCKKTEKKKWRCDLDAKPIVRQLPRNIEEEEIEPVASAIYVGMEI